MLISEIRQIIKNPHKLKNINKIFNTHHKYIKIDFETYKRIYNECQIEFEKFHGSVLYLGMGDLFVPLNQSDKVKKTTILEIDKDVIEKNKEKIKKDWIIINEDAFNFITSDKFDIIFIDIWYSKVDEDILNFIINKYLKYLKNNSIDNIYYLKKIFN